MLTIYFIGNICVRLLAPDTLGLDEAEQAFQSQWLLAGYGRQPPLYNWLQYFLSDLLGISVFSLSLLKNSLLFGAFIFNALSARLLLRDRGLIAVATLGLLTIPQVAFEMQRDLTHTVAVFFSASLFLYGLLRALKMPSAVSYAMTGLGLGCGAISKYNFALIAVGGLVGVLLNRDFRKRLLDIRLLLTIGIAVLIALPHLLWLKEHLDTATAGTVEKFEDDSMPGYFGHLTHGLLSIIKAFISFSGGTLIAFALLFRKDLRAALQARTVWTQFAGTMIVVPLLGILCMIFFAGASEIHERWLVPILFMLPLYLTLKLDAAGASAGRPVVWMKWIAIVVMIGVQAVLFSRLAGDRLSGKYDRLSIPYAGFAKIIKSTAVPGTIVVENGTVGGNMRLQMPEVPVVAVGGAGRDMPEPQTLKLPLLLVWTGGTHPGKPLPPALFQWLQMHGFKSNSTSTISQAGLKMNYGRPGDLFYFGYDWIDGH